MLRAILSNKNMSMYQLEKTSGVSHSTLSDIYNEKTNVDKCSVSIIKKISDALDLTIDDLYEMLSYADLSAITYSSEFDLFKSNKCQELKYIGELKFVEKYLSNTEIRDLFNNGKYPEALYLLSLVDYLLIKHKYPVPLEFEDIRKYKLNKVYVSKSIYLLCSLKEITITQVYKESIPLFSKRNIIEAEIDKVA